MNKTFRFKWWYILIVVCLLIGIATGLFLKPYQADSFANEHMNSQGSVNVQDKAKWIQFEPENAQEETIIFYPGGLVEPKSYAPLAMGLAQEGYRTYIVKMPLNLAVLDADRALEIIEENPNNSYVIGGHSLGGVMASRFTVDHPGVIRGAFFLASYPDANGSISNLDLPLSALSITGSKDEVLNQEAYEEAQPNFHPATLFYDIKGGNHAQFGSYGEQKGDGIATISTEEQTELTIQKLLEWLRAEPVQE
ncbi:alpha/beta hydrolase [Bacillus horti]|uniref:Dienelactone hydrolase n=1 Tax=Caldalkalibacillus horti TaxID=77523 RepID=A0ABT9VXH3_9BACI|nr:alpha/beta hydrolase [Bacillus horti]MDQ0165590.1 dienelactone hydrolase [Bacillus horti]